MTLSPATPVDDDDRRFERRLPLQMLVEYESTADFLVDYTANISIGGMFIKPAALAIRLLANMVAGHTLMAVLFSFGAMVLKAGGPTWAAGSITLVAGIFAVLITFLELFVAFLQAFIFMFLTAVFISLMAHEDHGHEEHAHDHGHGGHGHGGHGHAEPAPAH